MALNNMRWLYFTGLLLIALSASMLAGLMLGPVKLAPADVLRTISWAVAGFDHHISPDWQPVHTLIVWEVRFPRVLLGAFTGAGLALAGAGIQALIRNALADPYILGVSSGASVGATLVILTGLLVSFGQYALSTAAFLGALVAVILVFSLAQVKGRIATTRLLLSGIVLSMVLSAVTNVIIMASQDGNKIHDVLFWMMGSLAGADWQRLPIVVITVIGAFLFLQLHARSLNLLLMGEEAAITLGLNLHRFRKQLIVLVALLTGVLVAVTGAIGFIGLMMPHFARLLVGPGHRKMLLASLLLGAIFMVWADILARLVVAPEEMPIGVITALAGGPFFLWLLRRKNYSFGMEDS